MDSSVYWFGPHHSLLAPLKQNVSSEVVVVGGGIAGLTCAQALCERGRDVTLIERAFCGAGASGRSSGFITPDSELELSDLIGKYGPSRGHALWEFARSGVERIRDTVSALNIDCDYQVQDSLFVATTARAFRSVIELEHRTHASSGYRSQIYDRADLGTILGSHQYHGGVRYGGTFGLNAYAYCRALRDEIIRRGVRVFEQTPAMRLIASGVETPHGTVTAPTVAVLIDHQLPDLGLAARALYGVRSFLSISRPLRDAEIRAIFPGDRLMVWDTGLVYDYFRLTGDGRLLMGGADLRSMYSRHEEGARQRIAAILQRRIAQHFPGLNIEIEQLWSGLIGVSPDFVPVAGRSDDAPAAYFAGGAAGLPWAAALGKYLADKITDGRNELDDVFSPARRFVVGRTLQRLLGTPATFAISHAIGKYGQKARLASS
jgi:gamma-glutamylputrescine oxidase